MFQPRSIQSNLSFKDKIVSMDFILILSILAIGIISMFAMYSTDGGEFKYHTRSHIIRFIIFFILFFILSFFQIRFWHKTSTLIYLSCFILLLGVKYLEVVTVNSEPSFNVITFCINPFPYVC